MTKLFSAGATLSFIVVSAVLGVRLLLLTRRTRGVLNRFLLWAIAGVGAFTGSLTMSAVSFAGGAPWDDPLALSALGLGGLSSAICAWLAFMPPRAYLAWVAKTKA